MSHIEQDIPLGIILIFPRMILIPYEFIGILKYRIYVSKFNYVLELSRISILRSKPFRIDIGADKDTVQI